MIRRCAILLLLFLPLATTGCSDGNPGAPQDNRVHSLDWLATHPAAALAEEQFADCVLCHATDLDGNGDAVSCYSCHAFNATPPFVIHPADWAEPYVNHRAFAAANGATTCAKCHGADLHGSVAAPSCFSDTFDGRGCHAEGPGQAPHPVDGTYLNGANHGPDAKADLTVCQGCHGEPGGAGSNPRFNVGIDGAGGNGCESCHGINYAHPADWAGPNDVFHYTASNIQASCTLCHGVNLDGVGGVGVSCLDCHASAATFTLDCAACHGYPPDGSADVATATGVAHGNVAIIGLHEECSICHGMRQSDTGGDFEANENYLLFDPATETPGDHWDGTIDMNSAVGYNETNFGCDLACHANNAAHQLSDSGLPVDPQDFGGAGGGAPHPVDGSFLSPANHGPVAKADLTFCQGCHGEAGGPGDNPRFNVGIASVGGNGCESCHGVNYAHPANWAGPNNTFHYSAGNIENSCTLCHGANLDGAGGVGVNCLDCHASAETFTLDCTACHGYPPDGSADVATATGVAHRNVTNISLHQECVVCHGMRQSGTGGDFDADQNYLLFDSATDTPGDHWDGNINMNSATSYNEANFGCDAAGCHGNNAAHQLSDSGLPVELKNF